MHQDGTSRCLLYPELAICVAFINGQKRPALQGPECQAEVFAQKCWVFLIIGRAGGWMAFDQEVVADMDFTDCAQGTSQFPAWEAAGLSA